MKKIPNIFLRNKEGDIVDTHNPECTWVFQGEGVATEKLDGTNIRLTVRVGTVVRIEKRRSPSKSQKAHGMIDPWYVDALEAPENKWITEAVRKTDTSLWPDGEHCCEAIGPKIQDNPLGLEENECVPFDLKFHELSLPRVPREYLGLQNYLSTRRPLEGIVFHHPDGRRAKIRWKDLK